VPYSYSFVGNVVNTGSGLCSNTSGTFPARLSLLVDSVSGDIDGYFLYIQIQNTSNGLVPQNILLSFYGGNPTQYTAYDPQLLGASTATTGVSGTVVSGSFTIGGSSYIEVGSGFGTSSVVPLVLSSVTSGGTCGLKLSGVLTTTPD